QLFNNLLENSLRYTDPPGRLRIAVHGNKKAVHIDFQDSAPAVPELLLPRLFERLFRVESSRNRERGGAGLGLALCQTIVEACANSPTCRSSWSRHASRRSIGWSVSKSARTTTFASRSARASWSRA